MTVRTWSEDLPVTQVYYNSTIMMVFFIVEISRKIWRCAGEWFGKRKGITNSI